MGAGRRERMEGNEGVGGREGGAKRGNLAVGMHRPPRAAKLPLCEDTRPPGEGKSRWLA